MKTKILIAVAVISLILWGVYKMARKWAVPKDNPVYQQYKDLFAAVEKNLGMPENLLVRVAWQESRFREDIVTCQLHSSAGAQGIMQIVPRWHPNVDPCNPQAAIPYAGAYLHRLKQRFGTWEKALAAYNWGQGNLSRIDLSDPNWLESTPGETRQYVASVRQDLGGGLA